MPPGLLASIWRAPRSPSSVDTLRAQLGSEQVSLHASGREALRFGLQRLAQASGRAEVVLPAYTCFSVPSAVVAAGAKIRLVDVDDRGRIDASDLATLPLDSAAAVVVCNLFGIPEPIARVSGCARAAGAAVVDDAAQSLGARGAEGPIGARGELGVLSFGRGKPVSALGGGALVWPRAPVDLELPSEPDPGRLTAVARMLSFQLALWPPAFRLLAAIPALGIGETRFEPEFPGGGIPAPAQALLGPALACAAHEARKRAACARNLAERIAEQGGWRPLLAPAGVDGVYPRLALLAPDNEARDRALTELTILGAGASSMYPASLDEVPALRAHLAHTRDCPGARDVAARVLTLPTHGGLRGSRLEETIDVLGRVS